MTPADMSSPIDAKIQPARNGRAWHQSIGGKLLIAFGLIAALTVGATIVSLIRFNQIERVLFGLVDVSMPALKRSMDVQSRAADVIETAIEVGAAQDEVERFTGMSTATERIGTLWQAVEKLRTVVADEKAMLPIQTLIARIDSQVGGLDRTVGEGLASSQSPARVFQQIADATAVSNRTIAALLERIAPAQSGPADGAAAANAEWFGRLHDLRSDFNDAARVLGGVRVTNTSESIGALRAEFDSVLNRVQAGIAAAGQNPAFGADAIAALRGAAQRLVTLATGDAGVFTLRERFLQIKTSIASLTKALKDDGAQLRERVAALVTEAENQAAESQQLSLRAITTSRLWLMLIAVSTLVIAGLIVWLFVHRYVVSQAGRAGRQHAGRSRAATWPRPFPPPGRTNSAT